MKKRTAFIGAILSLIPLGQPLFAKTGLVLSASTLIFFPAKKALANSFNVDYDYAIELFDKGKYRETILECKRILEKYPNLSKERQSYIYLFLAMSHGYLNQHNPALQFNNKSISLNPRYYALYLDRANTKFQLGDKKGACADMSVASDLGNFNVADVASKYLNKWRCN